MFQSAFLKDHSYEGDSSKKEHHLKDDFIKKYGIKLEMAANYIFEAFFYAPDMQYLVNACCQVFPENVMCYDFDKIGTMENPLENDFLEEQMKVNKTLMFKTYKMNNRKYHEFKHRICDEAYCKKICFSVDKKKMAVFRKEKIDILTNSTSKKDFTYVIDIFDCSSIDFFTREEPLTPEDPQLISTIKDKHLAAISNDKQLDTTFMRFSPQNKYLLIEQGRSMLMIFDLTTDKRIIDTPAMSERLPQQYEAIVAVGINEDDVSLSMIGAKKTDFRNIDIFPLQYLNDINNQLDGKLSMAAQQTILISKNYSFSSIRLTEFDLKATQLKFSTDLTKVIFTDNHQKITLELSSPGKKQVQRSLSHLQGKTPRQISRYGDSDFLVASANGQDSQITIHHSSDASKKIKFYLRFVENVVKIRDICVQGNKINILVTRDDEEFVIYEYENFEKETYWQRFFENSNYIIEWPYVCYLKGQNHIIVQNAFNTSKAIYIKMNLEPHTHISHITVTDSFFLYLVVSTQDEYIIYEKDLDRCIQVLLEKNEDVSRQASPTLKGIDFMKKIMHTAEKPVARVDKSLFNGKELYKIFVRPSSQKDFIQSNLERMIFMQGNFTAFCVHSNGQTVEVDKMYKFKNVNTNIVAYNPVDAKGKKTNEVKLLQLGFSEFQITKVYEELDGKLVEFLVQDNQVLILSKQNFSDNHYLKIFDIINGSQIKFKCQILVTDPNLIGNIQTVEQIQNNIIPSGNDMYLIIQNCDQPKILFYKDVINIKQESGERMLFKSPLINPTYRKMMYFLQNKKTLKPKQGYIIPYINDNFISFNRRDNLTQFCQFYEYLDHHTLEIKVEMLNVAPFLQRVQHYSINGKLLHSYKLKTMFQMYGEHNLGISLNGQFFLQNFEDDTAYKHLNILRMAIDHENQSTHVKTTKEFSFAQALENSQQVSVTNKQHPHSRIVVEHIESIMLDHMTIEDESYNGIRKYYLNEVLQYFKQKNCEIVYKINDKHDIMIGFLYNHKINKTKCIKQLKELLLIKNDSQGNRGLYKVRLNFKEEESKQQQVESVQTVNKVGDFSRTLTTKLLKVQQQEILEEHTNQDQEFFLNMNHLHSCFDFCLTNEKLMVWSRDKIYHGNLDQVNSNAQTITLAQAEFQVHSLDEAQIQNISAKGQNKDDKRQGNYYIYIKILVDNSYCFYMKYNINKMKEFSSFDCSFDAMAFFDTNSEGYILDQDSIIDIDQGIPLYYYKTGMQNLQKQYIMSGGLDRGSRFCSNNIHFTVRNRVYLPYDYLSLVHLQNNKNRMLDKHSYNPELFFSINGDTSLHLIANNFKELEFILNTYEKSNPKLINIILLKNKDPEGPCNVLELAMKKSNARCVNLILEKLSKISMNNIHSMKNLMAELLDYNSFEDYLRLCFFTTQQMNNKTIFPRKSAHESENFFIGAHDVSFLDKKFYDNFEEKDAPVKPVKIRSLDAGWILKYQVGPGQDFMQKLSESDNMQYFEIDTIRLVVNYQWKIMRPQIILYLFVPFLVNMVLFNVYCVYLFDGDISTDMYSTVSISKFVVQICLLLFTIQTFYIEFKQITFHREAYLHSFWNLLDLTVVVMAPLIVIMDMANKVDNQTIRVLMSFCNLIFYLRFFYFLRIFDTSAHLVRTIIEITYDIRHFLFVFMLGIVGFGATFFILSNNNIPDTDNPDQKPFITSFLMSTIYSYRLSLGDFDTDAFGDSYNQVILWIIFIICSMFTAIILLNMLVAIMGESFNRVNEQSENSRVREHLQLIVENDFLINRRQHFGDVKYLIEIKDDIDDDQIDLVGQQIEELGNKIAIRDEKADEDMKELKEMMKAQALQLNMLKTSIQQINDNVCERQNVSQLRDSSFLLPSE